MRGILKYVVFLLAVLPSCKEKPYGDPLVKPERILRDPSSFVSYWYADLNLGGDFTGLNELSKEIPRQEFLQKVSTGTYLPLRLASDASPYYRLYKIPAPVDQYITLLLRTIGSEEYKHGQWEGKRLPGIHFTDLQGKSYDSESIQGKILVLDFWFIGCTACVHEMPELNKIAGQYKNREDILFAAIAFDRETELRQFVKKTAFSYDIISDTSAYLNRKLGVMAYPTAVIVNKKGEVVRILDDQYHSLENLRATLKQEAARR